MEIGGQTGRWPSYGMINTGQAHQEVCNTPMPSYDDKISHASDGQ